jgi:hypothetical protein
MAFIVSMIIDAMKEDLEEALALGGGNEEARVVRRGPLQDDPEANITSCLIYENDPADPDGWLHEQANDFQIDGTVTYRRRFTVELKIFLTQQKQSRKDATETMDLVHGRTIYALRHSNRIKGLQDEFGEHVYLAVNGVDKSRMTLRGGEDRWIGEGKLWFTAYTELP